MKTGSHFLQHFLIRDSEKSLVAYFLTLYVLIGTAIALARGTAEPLFLTNFGIQYLPTMYLLLSGLICIFSITYTAYSDRLAPEKFFQFVFPVLIIILIVMWVVLYFYPVPTVYPAFYLLYEVFSELMLIHAALYATRNLDTLQTKRLLPVMLAGVTLGQMTGGLILATIIPLIGVESGVLIWAAMLFGSLTLITLWHKKQGPSTYYRPQMRSHHHLQQAIQQIVSGMSFARRSQLVQAMFLAFFFLVLTFYTISYSVSRIYANTFPDQEQLASFLGMLTLATSFLALVTQLFFSNRIISALGVKNANLLYPGTTLLSLAGLMIWFNFSAALFASFNRTTLMSAIQNPVRSMFFNILPNEMQGRARSLSHALVYPLAIAICAIGLISLQDLEPQYFLAAGLVCGTLFLAFSMRMSHFYRHTLLKHLRERLFLMDHDTPLQLGENDTEIIEMMKRGIHQPSEQMALGFAQMLIKSAPDHATDIILERLPELSPESFWKMIELLLPLRSPEVIEHLHQQIGQNEEHRLRALRYLFFMKDLQVKDKAHELLLSPSSEDKLTGIIGILSYQIKEDRPKAINNLLELISGHSETTRQAFLSLDAIAHSDHQAIRDIEDVLQRRLAKLLPDLNDHQVAEVLEMVGYNLDATFPEITSIISEALDKPVPVLRRAAASCLHLAPLDVRNELIIKALEDPYPVVRQQAAEAFFDEKKEDLHADLAWFTMEHRGSPRAREAVLKIMLEKGMPPSAALQIAHSESEDAEFLYQAALAIEEMPHEDNPALEILKLTLKERIKAVCDLALLALENVGLKDEIRVIRAALKSDDTRAVASSIEALRNIKIDDIPDRLANILEQKDPHSESGASNPFQSLEDVINWCLDNNDPWLQTCAQGNMVQLNEFSSQ